MKIGIYLRVLSGLGGGARHTLAIAETLAKYHSVEVLTHSTIDPKRVAERFNMDLSRINIQYIPEQSWDELSKRTAQYDLFINSLHNSYISSRAKHSALLIFFPIQAHLPLNAGIRRIVAQFLNRHLTLFEFQNGIYGEERAEKIAHGAVTRQLDHHASIALLPSRHAYRIYFGLQNLTKKEKDVSIFLDGETVQSITLPAHDEIVPCPIDIRSYQQATGHALDIGIVTHKDHSDLESTTSGVQLVDFHATHPSHRLYKKLFTDWFPVWRDRIENVPPKNFLDAVGTYNILWSNSEFTRGWTQTYWGKESDICYPQVAVELFQPLKKKQQIVSVGRFFRGAHNKKHLVMIEAFKEMVDKGLSDWSLHLAGGVVNSKLHLDYLETVRAASVGYPIELHVNMPFNALQTLYGESAIYWHAAGHGESVNREPELLEHFGMTTVEAMAAGCVPIVINRGGQPEIFEHGTVGFHWDRVDELTQQTVQLIQNPVQLKKMSQAAILRSQKFSREQFELRLLASLEAHGCQIQ